MLRSRIGGLLLGGLDLIGEVFFLRKCSFEKILRILRIEKNSSTKIMKIFGDLKIVK